MSRFKKDQHLMEEARAARNEYARDWRAKNRDKVKQYNNNYWMKKAAKQRTETATA